MKPLLRNINKINNFKLVLILYTIFILNLSISNAAPTTNSPSKLLPSTNSQQNQHNQNIQLTLGDQTTQANSASDTFDQFEISTTTIIPIDKLTEDVPNIEVKTTIISTNVAARDALSPATTTAAHFTRTRTTFEKPKRIKTFLEKKIKDKSLKSPESYKIKDSESFENTNITKLYEKSTTTTATTTAMTTEYLDPKPTNGPFAATTNSEPIVVDYLTTTQFTPSDELFKFNDTKLQDTLKFTKKDTKTTENSLTEDTEKNLNTEEKQKPNKIKVEEATLIENAKFLNINEEKKYKHYENKKSHLTYKKKLRQKIRNFNHAKMNSDIRDVTLPSTSTSVPISSTTNNDIYIPIFLPTTQYTSGTFSTSADPFNKLNTKTVNPFKHQEAIDDISVSDTVSATTLETTTIETPLAMASATSTHQTTSTDNNRLKLKQIAIPSLSSIEKLDAHSFSSDDSITTDSMQLQSSSLLYSSTIQSSIKTQTTTNTPSESKLMSNNTTTTQKKNTKTLGSLQLETAKTEAAGNFRTENILLPTTLSAEKDYIAISTSNPILKYNPPPLRGTTKLFETSSSPTTFMARDQIKYTDDDGSNIEFVTTKFITDYPKISSENIKKEIESTASPPKKFQNTKLINTLIVKPTVIASTTATHYDYKNRLQSITEYKNPNSKKMNNKNNSSVNDNNENKNSGTILQLKDILPHKISPTESSFSVQTTVETRDKILSNENEYKILTNIPTAIASTTTTTSNSYSLKSNPSTLYSTLKDTFREVHTSTGSPMEKDISVLDSRVEEINSKIITTNVTAPIMIINKFEKGEAEVIVHQEGQNIKTNNNEEFYFSTVEPTTTAADIELNTEKLIKLTDVENIDSLELIKSEIAMRNNSDEKNSTQPIQISNTEKLATPQSLIGHDGLKTTKKKQLLYKHFKTAPQKHADEILSMLEHKLGPLHLKETVLRNKIDNITKEIASNTTFHKHISTEKVKILASAASTVASHIDSYSVKPITTDASIITDSIAESSTLANASDDSTIMLNIDLISENSQLEDSSTISQNSNNFQPMPTVFTKTTTESEYIKHKNYEKSLIPKLEWIPIASIDHFDSTESHATLSAPIATNNPSSSDNNFRKVKLADQLSRDSGDSQTKSLEIELVESTKSDSHLSETVPEFFEITKPISNQNLKTNDKENSESSPIEIQINVSEGFGNENENLEFSFRQMHAENAFKPIKVAHTMQNPPPGFQEIGEITIQRSIENQSADSITVKPVTANSSFIKSANQDFTPNKNNETEEILQVEITAVDNSTGIESFNEPKFILHSESNNNRNRENDDFFIPDLKLESIDELKEPTRTLDSFAKDSLDRDSDTIFYISNTEVKVAESKPTPNTVHYTELDSLSELQQRRNKTAAEINRSKLESQFFPAIYEEDVRIDVGKNKNSTYNQRQSEIDHYEEDIILSPLKNNFDPLKMEIYSQRSGNDNAGMSLNIANSDASYPLSSSAADVSYIGETLIEIEESTNGNPAIPPLDFVTYAPVTLPSPTNDIGLTKKDTDIPLGMIIAGESALVDDITGENTSGALLSDVIIQPAVIPEMSIGVPVIGELPPQIELKEIDYIPSSTNNNNGDKNKQQQSEQIDGGGIQYGGDLISDDDASGSAGSRYVFESSYPFGDERIRKVGRLRNEQNFDNDASDLDDNDSNSSGRDEDGFNSQNVHNINKDSSIGNNADLENDDNVSPQQQIVMHAVNSNFQKEQFLADFPNYETLKEVPQKRNDLKENLDTKNNGNLSTNNADNTHEMFNSTTTIKASNNNSSNTTTATNYQLYSNGSSSNSTEPEQLGNATAFIIMDDTEGNIFDLTDIQTLLIACFATLIPLVLSLLLAFAVRYLWKKYRRDDDPDEEGGLVGDTSIDPLAAKSAAMSQDELRTTESGYTLNRSNDTFDTNATDLDVVANGGLNTGKVIGNHFTGNGSSGNGVSNNNNNNNSCGANGSVITMTLKNNHLIVETEERNDISRDARETKMHYNSSDKDGVFVVEVARGADTTGAPNSPYKENHIGKKACSLDVDNAKAMDGKLSLKNASNHEEVQIHQPPADNFDTDHLVIAKSATISELDEANLELEERGINLGKSKTGLSQSDLSSSSNDSNKGYNYGKQELYTTEMKVYNPLSPKQKFPSDSMDSIKDRSENGFGDNYDTETSPHSRGECSNNSSESDKKQSSKNSKELTDNQNSENNDKSNSKDAIDLNGCDSDGVTQLITNDNGKSDINIASKEENNEKEMKITGNIDVSLNHNKNKDDSESSLNIIENSYIEENNKQIENKSTDKTSTTNICNNNKNNSKTIESNDSLPSSSPQYNPERFSSTTNKQNGHEEEKLKEQNKNNNVNDISSTASKAETEKTEATAKAIEKPLEEENMKIIHHENGLDEHNFNNSSNLVNGDYEKQNGIIHNGNDDDGDHDDNDVTVNDGKNINGISENIDKTIVLSSTTVGHENGFDSILSLPDPPSTEEIIQMNDNILMENTQLDSLPPPPPLDPINSIATTNITTNHTDVELLRNCNDELIKNSLSNGNCGIDTNNLTDIKILLNGDHHTNITKTLTEEQQKQQNGIGGATNGTTTPLIAVNGSS